MDRIRAEKFKAVRGILIDHWDPIGVKDVQQAQDEYDSYVPGILRLLEQGASVDVLTEHLSDIVSLQMGLTPVESKNKMAADKLRQISLT